MIEPVELLHKYHSRNANYGIVALRIRMEQYRFSFLRLTCLCAKPLSHVIRPIIPVFFVVAFAVFFPGCGGGSSPNGTVNSPQTVEVCGDGTIQTGETCDDGNTAGGDGCSATCQVEAAPEVCGDGTIQTGETCDDGNTAGGDGCSATCQVETAPEVCGDGTIQTGETCDDGNTVGGDGCSPTCQVEAAPEDCGDGIIQTGETCDDGNNTGGDGCSVLCQKETNRISAGQYHTCAITADGAVKCWGQNNVGQLGNGNTTDSYETTDVRDLTSGVTAVATGNFHTCALTAVGAVKCWGKNDAGQLGDGTTTDRYEPTDITGLSSGVAAIAAGGFHTCALTAKGGVKCWGENGDGQLGDGTTTDRSEPTDVIGLSSGVVAIGAGGTHTCALTTAGGVKCWGSNGFGELGNGNTVDRYEPSDVRDLTSGVTAVATGYFHTCALTAAGAVKCWGSNAVGGLGNGSDSMTFAYKPIDVTGLSEGVAIISAEYSHTCAVMTAGGVKCWGYNLFGQLGDGTTVTRYEPTDVLGLSGGVAFISAGNYHTCALMVDGGAQCWGYNVGLGDGTAASRSEPADVSGLSGGVASISAGGYHTCALMVDGGAQCWGGGSNGQLGDGGSVQRFEAVNVTGLSDGVAEIEAGVAHTCALTTAGGVKCWGLNETGQLGDGATTDRSEPVAVSGLSDGVLAISAGNYHTCALTTAGGVKCWGWNQSGQLGDGTTTDRSEPAAVSGLSDGVLAISAGVAHTCALTTAGGVKCWGHNLSGQLGDGTTTDRYEPTDITGLSSGVAAISAGGRHTCALTTAGGVKCWGKEVYDQMGDGISIVRINPTDVSGLLDSVSSISAGDSHTCALMLSGGVKCWGVNEEGQLGDGTTTDRSEPLDVSGLGSGMTAVNAGEKHTCALTTEGGAKCWGQNYYGQLGLVSGLTPVDVVGF